MGSPTVHEAAIDDAMPTSRSLPKAPVLGWSSFWPPGKGGSPCVADLPHSAYVSSGRAALFAALRQSGLRAGNRVLVPTYHCPTMVAPVVEAGMQPEYYPLRDDGLPALDRILERPGEPRAMFVAHYFGLAQGLEQVARWCADRQVLMVEDCAHTYFGMAGERPVGWWGDFATTSLSKFFPVPEAGLLASASRPIAPPDLRPCGARGQLKAIWDIVHRSHDHRQLAGLRHLAAPVIGLRGRRGASMGQPGATSLDDQEPADIILGCDMARIEQAPALAATWLHRMLPSAGIVARRRDHFLRYSKALADAPGARVLPLALPEAGAPYVFPLWVDGAARADAVYARMRQDRLPVFRWDRLWPGTPQDPDDAGCRWGRQVLQLLCHQSLTGPEVDLVARRALGALGSTPPGGG